LADVDVFGFVGYDAGKSVEKIGSILVGELEEHGLGFRTHHVVVGVECLVDVLLDLI
jgi:hypothetical protein